MQAEYDQDQCRKAKSGLGFSRNRSLRDSALNKATAFTMAERDGPGLHGLLPLHVSSQDEQVKRGMDNFNRKPSDLEKYIFMIAMDLKVIWDMSVTCCPGRADLGGHRG